MTDRKLWYENDNGRSLQPVNFGDRPLSGTVHFNFSFAMCVSINCRGYVRIIIYIHFNTPELLTKSDRVDPLKFSIVRVFRKFSQFSVLRFPFEQSKNRNLTVLNCYYLLISRIIWLQVCRLN